MDRRAETRKGVKVRMDTHMNSVHLWTGARRVRHRLRRWTQRGSFHSSDSGMGFLVIGSSVDLGVSGACCARRL
jgi:hypothetical protein